eukprot:scaffold1999_cov153-Amphora_coffeaeformis.AAC.14
MVASPSCIDIFLLAKCLEKHAFLCKDNSFRLTANCNLVNESHIHPTTLLGPAIASSLPPVDTMANLLYYRLNRDRNQ